MGRSMIERITMLEAQVKSLSRCVRHLGDINQIEADFGRRLAKLKSKKKPRKRTAP
jgi:hypothetical protein